MIAPRNIFTKHFPLSHKAGVAKLKTHLRVHDIVQIVCDIFVPMLDVIKQLCCLNCYMVAEIITDQYLHCIDTFCFFYLPKNQYQNVGQSKYWHLVFISKYL